jgi:signal transduction histidine kinase
MVRRVVDLIADITSGCQDSVTMRDAAGVASAKLVELFPGSSAVVFEREPLNDVVRAVAGANIPSAWQMRAVHLGEVPLLEEALRRPESLIKGPAHQARRSGPAMQAICAAIPDPVEPLYMILFLAPDDAADAENREIAVAAVRHLLGASAAIANGNAERSRTLAAIHHAKVEWELTADALAEVVGLLDGRGRIVRISRALERWGLGDVRTAIGRNLHDVLHPDCAAGDCALRTSLAHAWPEFNAASFASFEYADAVLGLDLIVAFQPASPSMGAFASAPWRRVAFAVTNVTSLRRAERDLTALNRTLEQRVAERTAEITATNRALRDEVARRDEAERSLRSSQLELQALSERLMSAQEEERKRIAQDLHDSVGQSLSAIKYSLERAQVLARRDEIKEAADGLEAAVARVQRVMDDVRGISMNLRPALLDDLGAASAVRWLCREWHDVYHDIDIEADIDVSDTEIPPALGTTVFRSVQESLNNVARHASAHRVQVRMRLEAGTLSVTVVDDGSGFSINGDVRRLAERPGLQGLRGLRERAERTGGRCEVASEPGRGTTVCLEWPVAPGQAAREANVRLN